ncbi:histidine phosphatase family protein [Ralstonia sp. UBA689]|uniref:histidine phosphatase family protein n=1 Tax=Ralstonia sp. UBA689 TaxID=1947373 RepID=UPI00260019BB|nr:histidine phosphatase family protein [Ralstonia sp. UBA689]
MAELFLVRHGQASFGAANYDQLSERGEQQGFWLGEYFAQQNIAFDRVICGTLRRHEQTVDAILRGMGRAGLDYEQHAGLNEYDFQGLFAALGDDHPELTRLATGSMRDHYRALRQVLHLWSEDKIRGPVPETWAQFQRRVAEARAVIQGGNGQRVLAVSSGGPIAVTAQQVLAAPAASAIALNLQIRNCSIAQYFFNAESFHLATFNGIPHLDSPQRRDFQTYG